MLDDLYQIHKIPLSILDSNFTKNDIDFINLGVSSYVAKIGRGIDSRTAGNLIAVIDSVNAELRHEVQWSPPEWLREIAALGIDEKSKRIRHVWKLATMSLIE